MKIIRFCDMKVCVPLKPGESQDGVEDRLLDALDRAGAEFITYRIETDESEEDAEEGG